MRDALSERYIREAFVGRLERLVGSSNQYRFKNLITRRTPFEAYGFSA